MKKFNLLTQQVRAGEIDKKDLFVEAGNGITEDEINFLRDAFEKGWLDPVHFGEVTGIQRNKIYMNYLSKAHNMLYIMFTGAESMNRMSTSLAAYRRAKRAGEKDPRKLAANINMTSHFPYGKLNRPELVRRAGLVGNVLYTFMTFPMQNLAFLKGRAEKIHQAGTPKEKKIARKVLGSNLAYLFAFGGLSALPFSFLGRWIWALFTDAEKDPDKILYEKLPIPIARGITKGIPAVFGNDLSWKVEGTDIFGAPIGYQTAKQIWRRVRYRGIEPIRRGEYWHTMFMGMPDFLMNPYKAFFLEGGSGVEGTHPIVYSPTEKVYKALGFTPTRETEVRQVRAISQTKRQERLNKINELAEMLIQSRKRKSQKRREALFRDMKKWNERERSRGIRGLTISFKDIDKSAKRKTKHRDQPFDESLPRYMRPFQKSTARSFGLLKEEKKGLLNRGR